MKKRSLKPELPAAAGVPAAGRSRREFLKLAAAGSAVALAAPALALAAESKAAPKAAAKAATKRPPEIVKGIEEQKGYLQATLAAIRAFELPANAEQAFTFVPLAPARKERR
jgi:secreted PhoX family phosphatase